MDFCKGNVGEMFWSTRKCVKKMRLQLFQVYTTDIIELFKKKYGTTNWNWRQRKEICKYIAAKYPDHYLELIAKACVFGELDCVEAELLNHLQKKRPLEHCKMALPEFKIIETEIEKEKVII